MCQWQRSWAAAVDSDKYSHSWWAASMAWCESPQRGKCWFYCVLCYRGSPQGPYLHFLLSLYVSSNANSPQSLSCFIYFQFYLFSFCILQELSLLAASFLFQMVLYEALLKRELRFPIATRQHSNCRKLEKKSCEELGIFLYFNGYEWKLSAVLCLWLDRSVHKLPQEHQGSRMSFRPLLAAAFLDLKIIPSSQALYFYNCCMTLQNFSLT